MSTMSDAFFILHDGLIREGPGDADSLGWALDLAGTPARARILDAGCGSGADLALLAQLRPGAVLVGRDLHPPFVARIQSEQPHVTAEVGDMLTPTGTFDLIWSAGAAYGPGVGAALAAWAIHLAPGGAVAFSDCLWRKPNPSSRAREFWAKEYPAMLDLPGHISRIETAGYRVLGARWLGDAAWEAYYGPLSARITALRPNADAEMRQVLEATQNEIDLWHTHGTEYGYYLTVVQPA